MPTRRDLLSGDFFFPSEEDAGIADLPLAQLDDTLRLTTQAMAADFEVVLNPGRGDQLEAAAAALELVHELEDQYSIYRPHSELSRLNTQGATVPLPIEHRLFELLQRAIQLSAETEGAFDPTAGAVVALWRACRRDRRLPTDDELAQARQTRGCQKVIFDVENHAISYSDSGVTLNLNAMGKGYALDRAAEILIPLGGDWLMHGGFSSILARGSHGSYEGWPVGIRHPLFPNREFATVLLQNQAMSTSGSANQFFRYQGTRYGHIIDPRTGWPVQTMLAVTVLAPDATLAEALSTAFFVLGVEKAREYCHNHPEVGALLIPASSGTNRLEPVVCNLPDSHLKFTPET
jgi:FAD:protein FMN transferase